VEGAPGAGKVGPSSPGIDPALDHGGIQSGCSPQHLPSSSWHEGSGPKSHFIRLSGSNTEVRGITTNLQTDNRKNRHPISSGVLPEINGIDV
jgi:hypothetical protein